MQKSNKKWGCIAIPIIFFCTISAIGAVGQALGIIPKPTPTPMPTNVVVVIPPTLSVTNTPIIVPTVEPTATEDRTLYHQISIEGSIRGFTEIDLQSVTINSGVERVAIISYLSAAPDSARLLMEWVGIFEAIHYAVTANTIPLDSIILNIGNSNGMAIGMAVVQMSDITDYYANRITLEELVRRIVVTNF